MWTDNRSVGPVRVNSRAFQSIIEIPTDSVNLSQGFPEVIPDAPDGQHPSLPSIALAAVHVRQPHLQVRHQAIASGLDQVQHVLET